MLTYSFWEVELANAIIFSLSVRQNFWGTPSIRMRFHSRYELREDILKKILHSSCRENYLLQERGVSQGACNKQRRQKSYTAAEISTGYSQGEKLNEDGLQDQPGSKKSKKHGSVDLKEMWVQPCTQPLPSNSINLIILQ